MRAIALQSGSNGNCIYVESGGVRLLFDAGISGCCAEERLHHHGREIREVDALVISHDHSDHARSLGIFQRKFGLSAYVTRETLDAARAKYRLGQLAAVHYFEAGDTLRFGPLAVETIPTPHDAMDGVIFVVDDGCHRLGICTDLGHVFDGLPALIASLDAVVLESNYEPELLEGGLYPEFLKQRIRGLGGHLSNVEAAELLRDAVDGRMRWVCLAHLSAENNCPEVALATHRAIFGHHLPIHIARRDRETAVLEV
ncbi:MAG: MBL fold metallo-hydrolase [Pirellulales bacterium]